MPGYEDDLLAELRAMGRTLADVPRCASPTATATSRRLDGAVRLVRAARGSGG
jgi:hypothetical protein